jgi:hypothetical protein
MDVNYACSNCPVQATKKAARPAIVQLQDDGTKWVLRKPGTPVHLAVLFRDPEVRSQQRVVKTVLDLRISQQGNLIAGKNCWVDKFLEVLAGLPVGLTVALDNGVRCPCGTKRGFETYFERARYCHMQTVNWFSTLQHPDGNSPSIVICDKDLAQSLSILGLLHYRNGNVWQKPRMFVEAVGDEVTYLDSDAIILAHPIVVRNKLLYRRVFIEKELVQKLTQLSRIATTSNKT